jgi:uracil-DNA glycosylase
MSDNGALTSARREAYLHALGISRWVLRVPPLPPVTAAPATAAATPTALRSTSSLSAARRAAYLKAMDMTCWVPRVPVAPLPLAVVPPLQQLESEPVVTETELFTAPAAVPSPPSAEITAVPPAALEPELALEGAEPLRLEIAAGAPDWDALREQVANCRACALCATRTQTVFGAGARTAELMLIGEAPGADEDRLGEPFVGRAGKLLTSMVTALGFTRDQVYIANVLKCRPPDNRTPQPEEAAHCAAFLHQQIALVQPRVIVALGATAAQHLLHTSEPIGKLRGQWWQLEPAGIPLLATYHPAYLLRSPENKAKSWEDLVAVLRRLQPGAEKEN